MEIDNPLHAAILSLITNARPLKEAGLSVVHNAKIKALANALRDSPNPTTQQPVGLSHLKPCPFCGNAPNSGCNYGIGGAYVNCVNLECACNPEVLIAAVHNPDSSLSLDDALVKARAAWNARQPEREVVTQLDEAEILAISRLLAIGIKEYQYKCDGTSTLVEDAQYALNSLLDRYELRRRG